MQNEKFKTIVPNLKFSILILRLKFYILNFSGMYRRNIRMILPVILVLLTAGMAAAQSTEELLGEIDTLKGRVRQLEDYIGSLESRLQGMESSLENNFNKFQDGVKGGLESYSRDLQINVNDQIRAFDDTTAVLDIVSKAYQKIDTNSGYFLISIRKVEPVVGGYR